MFKWFKKKQPQPEVVITETIFPTAKEMLEKTTQKWPEISSEEILYKMKSESAIGERKVFFYNSTISDETLAELKQQGYKVKKDFLDGAPFFRVSW